MLVLTHMRNIIKKIDCKFITYGKLIAPAKTSTTYLVCYLNGPVVIGQHLYRAFYFWLNLANNLFFIHSHQWHKHQEQLEVQDLGRFYLCDVTLLKKNIWLTQSPWSNTNYMQTSPEGCCRKIQVYFCISTQLSNILSENKKVKNKSCLS